MNNNFPTENFQITAEKPLDLSLCKPDTTTDTVSQSKEEAKKELRDLNKQLRILQEKLWAGQKHRVLVVFQAMDAGGKDGAIKKVFKGINPTGVRIESFKKPSKNELAHDYLWRIHKKTPTDGEIVVFNRSHYEDVLVTRVMNLVDKTCWQKRFEHINNFEKMLTDEKTTIVKFYLHISKDEQRRRLQARLDQPEKNWKFNLGDLEHRAKWDEYQTAFEDAINATTTAYAPWHVIPADNKWYRNLVISQILIQALEKLNLEYPPSPEGIGEVLIS